jgi:hypothetical protein
MHWVMHWVMRWVMHWVMQSDIFRSFLYMELGQLNSGVSHYENMTTFRDDKMMIKNDQKMIK